MENFKLKPITKLIEANILMQILAVTQIQAVSRHLHYK